MSLKTEPASTDNPDIPAPSAAKPSRPPHKWEQSLRVEFTRDEIVDIARKNAETYAELGRVEDEKKAVTATFKAKIDGLNARIAEHASKITSGFEYRTVACETRYDDPKPGVKTVYRLDTDAVVNIEPMTLAERQFDLALGAAEENADSDGADDNNSDPAAPKTNNY